MGWHNEVHWGIFSSCHISQRPVERLLRYGDFQYGSIKLLTTNRECPIRVIMPNIAVIGLISAASTQFYDLQYSGHLPSFFEILKF